MYLKKLLSNPNPLLTSINGLELFQLKLDDKVRLQ